MLAGSTPASASMPYADPEKQREYQRKWVARKRREDSAFREQEAYRREQAKARSRWLIAAVSRGPCTDCGFLAEHPCQMDLDHVWGEKIDRVSRMWKKAVDTLAFEIAKCELVCANCHRLRTQMRLN